MEEKPQDRSRQESLIGVLSDKTSSDAKFARELSYSIEKIQKDDNLIQFVTTVNGGRVGKIYNIGQLGKLSEL